MKALILITSLLFVFSAHADVFLKRYRDMIGDLKLNIKCKKALKRHYKRGRVLKSSLISKELIELRSWNKLAPEGSTIIHGTDFFHYTNYDIGKHIHNSVKDRKRAHILTRLTLGYEHIFDHLRKKRLMVCCGGNFRAGLYVAEDNSSSSEFGKMRWRIKISPYAKIIQTNYGGDLQGNLNWHQALTEVGKRYPRIRKKCDLWDLKSIILEDSGVDLVSYQYHSKDENKPWFILLNSMSITSSYFEYSPNL